MGYFPCRVSLQIAPRYLDWISFIMIQSKVCSSLFHLFQLQIILLIIINFDCPMFSFWIVCCQICSFNILFLRKSTDMMLRRHSTRPCLLWGDIFHLTHCTMCSSFSILPLYPKFTYLGKKGWIQKHILWDITDLKWQTFEKMSVPHMRTSLDKYMLNGIPKHKS